MSKYDAARTAHDPHSPPAIIGRYALHQAIARGGMATIHLARLVGDEGFSRIVAAKRLHPELAEDPDFVAMFLDEARIASRLQHRNVVPVLDVVAAGGEVMLVQELVYGVPLHVLLDSTWSRGGRVPLDIAIAIACQTLAGLHAAHETTDERGAPLNIVHRDISPQNVMIAVDGTARLLDFGIAKATVAEHITRAGTFKGKLAYSAPEQLRGRATQQSDIYSLAVVVWELVVGHRMHADQSTTQVVNTVLTGHWPTICEALALSCDSDTNDDESWRLWKAVDTVVQRGLALDPAARWATAADMEEALAAVLTPATSNAVATWVRSVGKRYLDRHDAAIAAEESTWRESMYARGNEAVPAPGHEGALIGEGTGATLGARRTRDLGHGLDEYTEDDVIEPPPPAVARTTVIPRGPDALALSASATLVALNAPAGAVETRPPTRSERIRASPWTIGALATVACVLGIALALLMARTHTGRAAVTAANVRAPVAAVAAPAAVAARIDPRAIAPRAVTVSPVRPADVVPATAVRAQTPPATTPLATAPTRAPTRPARSRPEPARSRSRTTATATTKPAVDCRSPYYFVGSKKLFKPACL